MKVLKSNVLVDLKVEQSLVKAAQNLPNTLGLNSGVRQELNRFKEIQKNPQILLQTLLGMELQKQQQGKNVNIGKDTGSGTLCHICGILAEGESVHAHSKVDCDTKSIDSIYKLEPNSVRHQVVQNRNGYSENVEPSHQTDILSQKKSSNFTAKKSYICKKCGKSYLDKSTLLGHSSTHDKRAGQCGLCYRGSRYKSTFSNRRKSCFHIATFPTLPNDKARKTKLIR